MIVTKRGVSVFPERFETKKRIVMSDTGKQTWKKCGSIAREIKKEIVKTFPEAEGKVYAQEFVSLDVRLWGIVFKAGGLNVSMTVQYKAHESWEQDKPFVYLDGISVDDDCRGTGLSTKFLDCIQRVVDRNVFQYLNFKDWSDNYWDHVMPKYPFLRDKYSNGWIQG